jgi:hypothetical protein
MRRNRVVRRPPRVISESSMVFSNINVRFIDVRTGSTVASCTRKNECQAYEVYDCLYDMAQSISEKLSGTGGR